MPMVTNKGINVCNIASVCVLILFICHSSVSILMYRCVIQG